MQHINKLFKLLCLFALQLLSTHSQAAQDTDSKIIFGVHPYLHATTLIERFTPLTEYLGAQLGQDILIRVASNYNDHIDAISHGKVDFAFMGPASFIKLSQNNSEFTLLGRLSFSGKNSFRGAIIVRKDSKLETMNDLRGKQFAFGDPNSTLSSLLPLRLLNDADIKLTDLGGYSNLKNHHNVALSVLLGNHHAGGVKEEVLREYESRGLRAIQWSPDIPTHLFVAMPGLQPEKTDQLRQLLLNLHQQPGASDILKQIKPGTTEIIPARIEEYEHLRKLISALHITNQQLKR